MEITRERDEERRNDDENDNEQKRKKTEDIVAYFVLVFAVVAASCAGPIYKLIAQKYLDVVDDDGDDDATGTKKQRHETDSIKFAFLLASWRLNATCFLHFWFFLYELIFKSGAEERAYIFSDNLRLVSIAGVALASHFALWMIGLRRTTLAHSLLFVTLTPINFVILTMIIYRNGSLQRILLRISSRRRRRRSSSCSEINVNAEKSMQGNNDNDNNDDTNDTNINNGVFESSIEAADVASDNNAVDDDDDFDDEDVNMIELKELVPSSANNFGRLRRNRNPNNHRYHRQRSTKSAQQVFKDASRNEIGGAVLGIIGSLLIALDAAKTHSKNDPTVFGDLLSWLSSVVICAYVAIAGKLRKEFRKNIATTTTTTTTITTTTTTTTSNKRDELQLFMFSFPVVFVASFCLIFATTFLFSESLDTNLNEVRGNFMENFAWMSLNDYGNDDTNVFLLVSFLAIVPGTFGHVGFIYCLRTLSNVTVAFSLSFEPIIGSFVGYCVGVSKELPNSMTIFGGFVLMIGVYIVSIK